MQKIVVIYQMQARSASASSCMWFVEITAQQCDWTRHECLLRHSMWCKSVVVCRAWGGRA